MRYKAANKETVGKMARKEHPVDVYERQQIARAEYYVACYLAGRNGRVREEFATLEAAKAGAIEMTRRHGKHGRQACLYAVTPEGASFPIGEGYRTQAMRRCA